MARHMLVDGRDFAPDWQWMSDSIDSAYTDIGSVAAATSHKPVASPGGATPAKGGGAPPPLPAPIPPVTPVWPTLNPPTGSSTPPTDIKFGSEWNLTGAIAGIRVAGAWQNYTGVGVRIGIVDDGIDYTHSDLSPNYVTAMQYDAVTPDGSALGTSADDHGTTVAGVLAAARNGTGLVGVAYDSGIAGIRIGYGANGNSAQYADALRHLASSGFDVGNCSWGYSTPYQDNFNTYWSSSKSAIQYDVQSGRHGLGVPIVYAAMNNRGAGDNVNYHNYQNDPFVITVAATDANGKVASFSNPGAALLVSAPGTSIVSDDRVGSAGWSSGDYATVQGTSYSAPAVAGVIVLMLQANPNLGFRDVQQILAYSARQTDTANSGWQTNGAMNWNGGGLHFSHDYGFGIVDATAAVHLAESWNMQSTFADMSTETLVHTDNLTYAGGGSIHSQISLATPLSVQKMVVDLNITDANVKGLTVSLTSSAGTTAILASHPASGTGSGIVFETSANNFWGENAAGTWTLTVSDGLAGDTGKLNGWTLTALGNAWSTPADYFYTNDFATAAGASRAVLNDSSGTATINTATVTGDNYLDLRPGAVDTIAGRNLTIGTGTIIKNLWAGDGNDMIFCSNVGSTVQGGRGNDTIVAGQGADTLSGGPGNDTFDFDFLKTAPDVITDFATGSDVIDVRQLFTSIGYTGSDPVADHWLNLTADGRGGTNIGTDLHNGSPCQTLVDVQGVAPTAFRMGADLLT
jgi:subtilisin-like proprotein convertase family protein